jgi:hypothetical protein
LAHRRTWRMEMVLRAGSTGTKAHAQRNPQKVSHFEKRIKAPCRLRPADSSCALRVHPDVNAAREISHGLLKSAPRSRSSAPWGPPGADPNLVGRHQGTWDPPPKDGQSRQARHKRSRSTTNSVARGSRWICGARVDAFAAYSRGTPVRGTRTSSVLPEGPGGNT